MKTAVKLRKNTAKRKFAKAVLEGKKTTLYNRTKYLIYERFRKRCITENERDEFLKLNLFAVSIEERMAVREILMSFPEGRAGKFRFRIIFFFRKIFPYLFFYSVSAVFIYTTLKVLKWI